MALAMPLGTPLPVSLPPMSLPIIGNSPPTSSIHRSLDHSSQVPGLAAVPMQFPAAPSPESLRTGHAMLHQGGLPAALNPAVNPGLLGGDFFGQQYPQTQILPPVMQMLKLPQADPSQSQFAARFLHQMQILRTEQVLQSLLAHQRQLAARNMAASMASLPAGQFSLQGGGDPHMPPSHPMAHMPFGAAQSRAAAAPPTFAPVHHAPPDFMTTTCLSDFLKPKNAQKAAPVQPTASPKAGKRARDGEGQASRKKRTYVKAACLQCRSAHLACDDTEGGGPCRNCVRNGSTCERGEEVNLFVPPSLSSLEQASHDAGHATPHTTSSSPDDPNDPSSAVGRRYVKAACSCCRKAHLACDNFRPCRSCMRSGQNCEIVRSQRRRLNQRRYLPSSDASSPATPSPATLSPATLSPATQKPTSPWEEVPLLATPWGVV
ncbi:hypothetical protein T484DRAFT_1852386 [Baffinella frigidus]|nr:hypothetical protein T484DRAFT_1852386 [Cryptophyta sp. CCMP2293]